MLTGLSSNPLWKKTRRHFIKIIMITWKSNRGSNFYWAVDLLMNFKQPLRLPPPPQNSWQVNKHSTIFNSFSSLLFDGCFDDFGIVATLGQRHSFLRPFCLCKYLLHSVYCFIVKLIPLNDTQLHADTRSLKCLPTISLVCRVNTNHPHLLHILFFSR